MLRLSRAPTPHNPNHNIQQNANQVVLAKSQHSRKAYRLYILKNVWASTTRDGATHRMSTLKFRSDILTSVQLPFFRMSYSKTCNKYGFKIYFEFLSD